MKTEIKIKGKSPILLYPGSLAESFDNFDKSGYSPTECLSLLRSYGAHDLNLKKLTDVLFGYRQSFDDLERSSTTHLFAGPFTMDLVVNTLFRFNLDYQDVAIRLFLEQKFDINQNEREAHEVEVFSAYEKAINGIAIVLKTRFFRDEMLFLKLTNSELDIIVLNTLGLMTSDQTKKSSEYSSLLETGKIANVISSRVMKELYKVDMGLDYVLKLAISSGVIWWSSKEVQKRFLVDPEVTVNFLKGELIEQAKKPIVLDSYQEFKDVIEGRGDPVEIVYFLDDNGELVWHLLIVSLLLEANKSLRVIVVVNEIPVTNNVNITTLREAITSSTHFGKLANNERFTIHSEHNELPCFDLRFCTSTLRSILAQADLLIVNGVSFFEKIQYLPKPAFYLFTVYSSVSVLLTGLKRGDKVFAKVPRLTYAYSDVYEDEGEVHVRFNFSRNFSKNWS